MIQLTIPRKQYLKSYMEAYDEFTAMGMTSHGLSNAREEDIFRKYEDYRLGRNLKPGRVASEAYWLVDEERNRFLGEIRLRHTLNETLRLRGGHIGYAVRPSCWNRGWGTLMLKLVLEKARDRGLHRVLCTCNKENMASARVMEHNGFQLEDTIMVDGAWICRYWKELG